MKVTKTHLAIITGRKESAFPDSLITALNDVLYKYGIGTPLRVSHFIAQIAHESGGFRYREEIASGSAYEGRLDLGNTEPGDGVRFKGRGFIQLTGRANYRAYGMEDTPEKVSQDPYAVDVAGWYWKKRGLNAVADEDSLVAVTKLVNGGVNGIKDRKELLNRAKALFVVDKVVALPAVSDMPIEKEPSSETPRKTTLPSEFVFDSKPLWASKRIWGIAISTVGLFGANTDFLKLFMGEYENLIQVAGLVLTLYGSLVAKKKLVLWPK
jgi:predicted chitinase